MEVVYVKRIFVIVFSMKRVLEFNGIYLLTHFYMIVNYSIS